MSIWSMLLACQGFVYDGPAGVIGFKPVWQPDDHISFFTSAEGWGLFKQRRNNQTQTESIELKHGKLRIRELVFELGDSAKPANVTAVVDGQEVAHRFKTEGKELKISFDKEISLKAGLTLVVEVKTK
jgi:non-lysosomal glucosylceramidase